MRAHAELPIAAPDEAILAVSIDKVRDLPDPATCSANVNLGHGCTAAQAITGAVATR